jgi:hypothetical protein
MRDFNNLRLIQKIEDNPSDYIIQRKVNLLNSFLFGYEDILLKLKNIETLKNKYENMPSMDEYAKEKYNVVNIGTRNYKTLLKYNCENEVEYFTVYLQFIYSSLKSMKQNIHWKTILNV